MTRKISILTITSSGVLSILIATAWVNYGAVELGALIYLIVPLITTIGTIILFFIADIFLKGDRTVLTVGFACINIFTGVLMRLDFYYDILNW